MPLFGDSGMDLSLNAEKMNLNELPLIALRDMVMFPGMTMPISVGREKSVQVIKVAEKTKKYIGLFCQLHEVEDPTFKDLYNIGVIAEVIKEVEMPDGSHSLFVQSRRRIRLEQLVKTEPYLVGEVTLLEDEKSGRRWVL